MLRVRNKKLLTSKSIMCWLGPQLGNSIVLADLIKSPSSLRSWNRCFLWMCTALGSSICMWVDRVYICNTGKNSSSRAKVAYNNAFRVLRKKSASSLLNKIRVSANSLLNTVAARSECPIMRHLISITKSLAIYRY